MQTPTATSPKRDYNSVIGPLIALAVSVAITLLLMVSMRSSSGWIVLAGCGAIPIIYISLKYPEFIAAFVVFLLFSNALVVATRFHGLPKIVATAAPPAALLFVWLYQLIGQRETIVFPRAWLWAIALVAAETVSAIFCRFPDEALGILKSHVIEGLGLFLIVGNVIRTRKSLQQVVVALLLAGSFLGGLSLWQQMTGTHHRNYGGFAQIPVGGRGFETGNNLRQMRSAGPLGEQNRYAQNLLMLLPLAVLPVFTTTSWKKLGYLLAAVLISAGCMLTFSRGAAVAFVMLSMVMAFSGYIQSRHLLMFGAVTLLFLLAFPQLATRMDSFGTLIGYLRGDKAAYAEEVDGAIKGRATSMLAALRVATDYPLLGVGPGNFPFYNREYAKVGGFRAQEEDRQAHCLYLHLAAEMGLVGLGAFLAMVAVTLRGLHRVWSTHKQEDPGLANLAGGFALATLAYLLTGLFLHYSFIRFFWLILALSCCVPIIADRDATDQRAKAGLNA